ncbi:TPA: hypothetical protein ACH3X2_002941 [Trebouxia sp. C0005]
MKDNAEIKAHKNSHDVEPHIIKVSYASLVFGCINATVFMIGTVFTIGFLAKTPPTLDFCHILFAYSRKAITAALVKGIKASVDKAVKVKDTCVNRLYFRAASVESRELPT